MPPDPNDPDGPEGKAAAIRNNDRSWLLRLWDFFAGAPQAGATDGKARIRLSDDTMQNRIINRVADNEGKALFDAELFRFFADDFVRAVGEGRAKVVVLPIPASHTGHGTTRSSPLWR